MDNSTETTTEQNWLITILEKLLSADNFFSKTLLAVISQLKNQRYLFVLGVILLVVMALTIVYLVEPGVAGPFYAALGVILIVVLVALGDVFLNALPPEVLSKRSLTSQAQEDAMIDIPEDCESIRRELENARTALHHLNKKAAGIPLSERPARLSSDIEYQEKLVKELQSKLDECLARSQ